MLNRKANAETSVRLKAAKTAVIQAPRCLFATCWGEFSTLVRLHAEFYFSTNLDFCAPLKSRFPRELLRGSRLLRKCTLMKNNRRTPVNGPGDWAPIPAHFFNRIVKDQ